MMLSINKNVVLICDRVNSREGINILSDNLEFTSNTYFDALKNSLEKISPKVFYYESPEEFLNDIKLHKDDIVISAIWSGVKSRNRKALIASICEAYNITYLGADAYVQALCQDKQLSKYFCKNFDIEVPNGIVISDLSEIDKLKNLSYPVIVKPNLEGSSIGISDNSIADTFEEVIPKIETIINDYSPILVEEYIPGIEVSACCVGVNKNLDVFEIVELQINGESYNNHRVWGYESKKAGKSSITRKVITDSIDEGIKRELKNIFFSLGKVDYMRIDGRLYNNKFYLIELTPDCSLHPDCFMVKSFTHNNMTYTDMMSLLLNNTLKNSN